MTEYCLKISTYLFCIFAIIDPANSILGLKIPTFILFLISLAIYAQPRFNNFMLVTSLIFINVLSFVCGQVMHFSFDTSITIQFLIFFFTLYALCWDYVIDLFDALVISSVILSIITIAGFIVVVCFPDVVALLYGFSQDNNTVFMMSERNFLGITFYSFFYRSLPIVVIPASIYFGRFLNEPYNKRFNLSLALLFLAALFCGGNRAMILGVFVIITISSYSKFKDNRFFKAILFLIIVAGLFVAYLAITEKGEESYDIKYGHLVSYVSYYSEKWYTMFLGAGAGSEFYSQGFESMTGLTEWTYFEIIRMYGLVGLALMIYFLFKPVLFSPWPRNVRNWNQVAFGYCLYMILAGSNPNIFCSTGLICILVVYSYIANPKYQMSEEC